MVAPSLLSPNLGNLEVGRGIVSMQTTGDSEYRDVGNATEFQVTLTVTELDHFSNRGGVKEKDFTVVLTRGGTVHVIMDEWTPKNMAIMFMGTVDEDAAGGPILDIMSEDAVEAKVRFIGHNEIGPKYTVILDRVRFIPSAAVSLIASNDSWGLLDITGRILKSSVTSKFGTVQLNNLNSET